MKGSCLCGAVTITAPDAIHMHACHCGMCRRWGGGPLLSVNCGPDVQIAGEDKVTVFKSSDWAERAFCSRCGTHLYYRFVPANNYALSIGLFEDGSAFEFAQQIYIDRKPALYSFADQTEVLTEAEVIAKFAPG